MPRGVQHRVQPGGVEGALAGLAITVSPGAGASSGTMSRRLRRRPARGPSVRRRRCAASGRRGPAWPAGSRPGPGRAPPACGRPAARARAPAPAAAGTAARWRCSGVTSLPSDAPKPPGSTKSRCMSMTTSAVRAGSKRIGIGRAATGRHAAPFSAPAMAAPMRPMSASAVAAFQPDVALRHHHHALGQSQHSSRSSLTSSTPRRRCARRAAGAWISAAGREVQPEAGVGDHQQRRLARRARAPARRAARCRPTGFRSARPGRAS